MRPVLTRVLTLFLAVMIATSGLLVQSVPSVSAQGIDGILASDDCTGNSFQLLPGLNGAMDMFVILMSTHIQDERAMVYLQVDWFNYSTETGGVHAHWINPTPVTSLAQSYTFHDIGFPGVGLTTGTLTGWVWMGNGKICVLVPNSSKVGLGIAPSQQAVPITADLNGDGLADDSHCGNKCDKRADALNEAQMEVNRQKVCGPLKDPTGVNNVAFKDCKDSGLKAIKARESRGYDCWMFGTGDTTGWRGNRNGWSGPTAPENAPSLANGTTWNGKFQGNCGYQLPPPPPPPTGRPVSNPGACVLDPVTHLFTCPETGSGTVHALNVEIPVQGTTSGNTPLPAVSPPYAPGVYINPEENDGSVPLNFEWSNIPNAGSGDWVVLYNTTTNTEQTFWRDAGHDYAEMHTSSCSHGTGTAKANGNCSVNLYHVPQGTYEFRLFHNSSKSAADLIVRSPEWTRTPSYCELHPGSCSE